MNVAVICLTDISKSQLISCKTASARDKSNNIQLYGIFLLFSNILILFFNQDGEESVATDETLCAGSLSCLPAFSWFHREAWPPAWKSFCRKTSFHLRGGINPNSQNTFQTEHKGKKWLSAWSLAPNWSSTEWNITFWLVCVCVSQWFPQTDSAAWIDLKGIVHPKLKTKPPPASLQFVTHLSFLNKWGYRQSFFV